jgi:hypothetical protein
MALGKASYIILLMGVALVMAGETAVAGPAGLKKRRGRPLLASPRACLTPRPHISLNCITGTASAQSNSGIPRPASRPRPRPPSYPTFFSALGSTPNTNYGKTIVEALKLQTTLSNPKLALTVFMPEDKVRCGSVCNSTHGRAGRGARLRAPDDERPAAWQCRGTIQMGAASSAAGRSAAASRARQQPGRGQQRGPGPPLARSTQAPLPVQTVAQGTLTPADLDPL